MQEKSYIKKIFLRLMLKAGFVEQQSADYIFNSMKETVAALRKSLTQKDNEIEIKKNRIEELKKAIESDDRVLELHRKNKQLREDVAYFRKELHKYIDDGMSFEEYNNSKLSNWSNEVKKAYNSKCDICGSSEELTAHHLYAKSFFQNLKYNIDNGVCLCQSCHTSFHQEYPDTATISPKKYLEFKAEKLKV